MIALDLDYILIIEYRKISLCFYFILKEIGGGFSLSNLNISLQC
jgi:hypothetical protein